MSGEMMRILCSASPTCPATSAKTVRIAWGAWVVIHTVSLSLTLSKCATHPHVSMDATWMRGHRAGHRRPEAPQMHREIDGLLPAAPCANVGACGRARYDERLGNGDRRSVVAAGPGGRRRAPDSRLLGRHPRS